MVVRSSERKEYDRHLIQTQITTKYYPQMLLEDLFYSFERVWCRYHFYKQIRPHQKSFQTNTIVDQTNCRNLYYIRRWFFIFSEPCTLFFLKGLGNSTTANYHHFVIRNATLIEFRCAQGHTTSKGQFLYCSSCVEFHHFQQRLWWF